MDPTSYRIPIIPEIDFTATATHQASSQELVVRKRKQSSSSVKNEFEVELSHRRGKKARLMKWTDGSKVALLENRLHLDHIFKSNNETVIKRAWEKVGAMLDISRTGSECVEMFDLLVEKKQKIDFQGVTLNSFEWQQYQTLEKLFLKRPALTELYDSFESPSTDEDQEVSASDEESTRSDMEKLLFEFSKYDACFTKFCDHIRDQRSKRRLREYKLMRIVEDLVRIRQENMLLVSQFLKRILFRFNEQDEVARRESLEALASMFPSLYSMSSVAIPTINLYLKSSAFQNDRLEAYTVFLISHFRSAYKLFYTTDEEDAFYVKFLPFHEQYLEKPSKCPPELISNQSSLSNFNFKGHLHVSRSTVEELITRIGLVKSKKPNPIQVHVSIERQMILLMWYLTHNETYEQLALRFSVVSTEVRVILRHFISLIAEDLNFICWPDNESEKREVIKAFESMRTDSFPGVIGALGTKYLSRTCLVRYHSGQGKIVRKKYIQQHIAVQAVVDANHIFNSLDIAWLKLTDVGPEGTETTWSSDETKNVTRHDAIDVFWKSRFYVAYCRRPKDDATDDTSFLPENIHVVADSTYPLLENVMVPYNTPFKHSPSQFLFDQQLVKSRQAVEVAFGKVMNRFIILSFMDHSLSNTEGLIKSCIGIHNFCMKEGDDFDANQIKLPELELHRISVVDEAAVAKRDKICAQQYNGEVSYVYRNSTPSETGSKNESVLVANNGNVR